jgi:hypothetical protein
MELHSTARSRQVAIHLFLVRLDPGGVCDAVLPVHSHVVVELNETKVLPPILQAKPERCERRALQVLAGSVGPEPRPGRHQSKLVAAARVPAHPCPPQVFCA